MSLCKLIDLEIQKIAGLQVDPAKLDPGEYDELMEQIPKEIGKLTALTKILNLSADSSTKIDEYWNEKGIDIKNIELKDLFAVSVEYITNKTVFFIGDLDYTEYEELHPNAKSLPKSLKMIFGEFDAYNANIEMVDFEFVENSLRAACCNNLRSVRIRECGSMVSCEHSYNMTSLIADIASNIDCNSCYKLQHLVLGHITSTAEFTRCKNLQFQNIYSTDIKNTSGVTNKIEIGAELLIKNSGLASSSAEELLEKFDIDSTKIIRN